MLENYQNYYVFDELVKTGKFVLDTSTITRDTWDEYYYGIKNILKDGIETEQVHNMFITIRFADGASVDLSLFDLFFNMIFWYIVIESGKPITGEYLFFPHAITQDAIKDYFDRIIVKVRENFTPKTLNNIIADTLHRFIDIDDFSFYIANTINLKDTIDLEDASPEFDKIMHTSLADKPIDEVKDDGLKLADRSVEIIVNDSEKLLGYDHCLKNAFMSQEGINRRQYKEFAIHIGTKPNGLGGVHPAIIDGSYLSGALNTIQAQFMDSSAARIAQIQAKKNVGTSGNLARILGINNIDTIINPDPNYACNTRNFITITLKNKKVFNRFVDRWYRFTPDDVDHYLTRKDTHLIGQTLLFRSPICCASEAHGHGICYKCYGGLAHINNNIKVGKYAAEQFSSQTTQKQLSAKHLLETVIPKITWSPEFYQYFTMDINAIYANPNATNADIFIDPESICSTHDDESDEASADNGDYSSFITEFTLIDKKGIHTVSSEEGTEMYLSSSFKEYLYNLPLNDDGMYQISLKSMVAQEMSMFLINIDNNELVKTLKDVEGLINRKPSIQQYNKSTIIQKLVDLCIEGKLTIQAVHLEVLIMNQIRSIRSILRKPEWENDDEDYVILTLDQALKDNPSVIISLLYQNLGKTLMYPLTFQKSTPSCMDLFFMKQPQNRNIDPTTLTEDNTYMLHPVSIIPDKGDTPV